MRGREFLDLAREIATGGAERHRCGTIIHAYYALVLECRDALVRWGFRIPLRDNMHTFVRLRFIYAVDNDLKQIGLRLDELVSRRNWASYNLMPSHLFADATAADDAIQSSDEGMALLDTLDGDPARRAAAIAAIRP